MKKLFTFIGSALLLSQPGFAQITLTSAVGYTVGSSNSIQTCTTTGPMPSAAGANVAVDYSTVTANGAPQSQSFVAPATTTYGASFPSATVALAVASTQGNSGFSYYKVSSTKMELIGIGTTSYLMLYSNPCTLMSFPMSYNDNMTDNFNAQYTVNGVDVRRGGTISIIADAYGTIKTPAGTSSYLRLKITQQNVDSFFMNGSLIQSTTSQVVTYNYMNNGSSAPIFSYSEIITAQGTSTTSNYNTVNTTGVTEMTSGNLLGLSAYPNPAKNTIMLTSELATQDVVTVKVVDIAGKEVVAASSMLMQAGRNEMPIDIGTLSSGLYSVVLQSETMGTKAIKFTVQ
jgi:hypothetical protein